ncbi:OpgC domain-containing protein [Vibrio panuliri]|uniref:OpgC protein n=1 Tax=Vibrio panuliri TaxID=1381081 RepID=A0ABX3FCS2_9VIBR|nr:OpgC domain-containing protein [Vibrio panuliri]KAB1457640.1 DUF2141 domain-containing protein [Vibrio panuliri]OLQ87289.1 OpgC protein [Vibrio panuliri]
MKRIPALDSIRGLLLVIMTINHLFWISGGNSIIQMFSLQPLGQFGAAEGFILVSGFLAGAIYSRPHLSNSELRSKAWSRAWSIYKYHIVCLLIVFVWFALCVTYMPTSAEMLEVNLTSLVDAPWSSVLLSAALVNKPSYLEILPLYIMYMLLLPILIAAYRRGWMAMVLLSSVVVWAMSGHITDAVIIHLLPGAALQTGYFDPFAWQLLFIGASAVGYAANQGNFNWYSKWLTLAAGVTAAVILLMHHGFFLQWGIHQGVLYGLADKPELGWLRLLNIAVWAYLIAAVIKHRPNLLVFKPLSYIGRHSLQVFAWHTVMIYLMAPMLWAQRFNAHYEWLVFVCLASIWIPAWIREHSGGLSQLKRWSLGAGSAMTVGLMLSVVFRFEPAPQVVANTDGLAPLTIKVANIKGDGPIILLVYGEGDNLNGMPSIHAQGYSVSQATAGIRIDAIPVGKYAIFAYQDNDGNQRLTSGSNGMPTEGFGYSNNPALQGPPSMEQVQFSHPDKAHQTIQFWNF